MLQVTLTVLQGGHVDDTEVPKTFTRSNGSTLTLVRASKTAGDAPSSNNALFRNQVMSKQHAIISWVDGGIYIKDNESTHGTVIHRAGPSSPAVEVKADKETRLYDGNLIVLGKPITRLDPVQGVATYHPLQIQIGIRPVGHGLGTDPREQASSVNSVAQRKYALSTHEQLFTDEEEEDTLGSDNFMPSFADLHAKASSIMVSQLSASQSTPVLPTEVHTESEHDNSTSLTRASSKDKSTIAVMNTSATAVNRSLSEELDVVPMTWSQRTKRRRLGREAHSPSSLSRNSTPGMSSGTESVGMKKRPFPVPSASPAPISELQSTLGLYYTNVSTAGFHPDSVGVPSLPTLLGETKQSTSSSFGTSQQASHSTFDKFESSSKSTDVAAMSSADLITSQFKLSRPTEYIVIDDEDVDEVQDGRVAQNSAMPLNTTIESTLSPAPATPNSVALHTRNLGQISHEQQEVGDANELSSDDSSDSQDRDEMGSEDNENDSNDSLSLSEADSGDLASSDEDEDEDEDEGSQCELSSEVDEADDNEAEEEEEEEDMLVPKRSRKHIKKLSNKKAKIATHASDDDIDDETSEASSQIFDTRKAALTRIPVDAVDNSLSESSEPQLAFPMKETEVNLSRGATATNGTVAVDLPDQLAKQVEQAQPETFSAIASAKVIAIDKSTQSEASSLSSTAVQTGAHGKDAETQMEVEKVFTPSEALITATYPDALAGKRKYAESEETDRVDNGEIVSGLAPPPLSRPKRGLPWRSALTFTAGAVAAVVGLALIPEME